eukprot:547278-Prorocentrum_minimum.AAC.3
MRHRRFLPIFNIAREVGRQTSLMPSPGVDLKCSIPQNNRLRRSLKTTGYGQGKRRMTAPVRSKSAIFTKELFLLVNWEGIDLSLAWLNSSRQSVGPGPTREVHFYTRKKGAISLSKHR